MINWKGKYFKNCLALRTRRSNQLVSSHEHVNVESIQHAIQQCQVKKNPKIREKLGLPKPHLTHHSPIQFFWGGKCSTKKKATKKHKIYKNNNNPSWGLTHPQGSDHYYTVPRQIPQDGVWFEECWPTFPTHIWVKPKIGVILHKITVPRT